MKTIILIALLFISSAFAGQKCKHVNEKQGFWFEADGKLYPCATTTRYWDGLKGACGCGYGQGSGTAFSWQHEILTAAASSSVFGQGGWCGHGCGECLLVTPTGGFIDGQGSAPRNTKGQIVLVSNLCPADGNQQWCSSPNHFGYTTHFDLMDINMHGVVAALGWNNPEVYYHPVPCPNAQETHWKHCQCA